MTDEEQVLQLSPERLLAAVLTTTGRIEVSYADLLADYTEYQIGVDQAKEDALIFFLSHGQTIEGEIVDDSTETGPVES